MKNKIVSISVLTFLANFLLSAALFIIFGYFIFGGIQNEPLDNHIIRFVMICVIVLVINVAILYVWFSHIFLKNKAFCNADSKNIFLKIEHYSSTLYTVIVIVWLMISSWLMQSTVQEISTSMYTFTIFGIVSFLLALQEIKFRYVDSNNS